METTSYNPFSKHKSCPHYCDYKAMDNLILNFYFIFIIWTEYKCVFVGSNILLYFKQLIPLLPILPAHPWSLNTRYQTNLILYFTSLFPIIPVVQDLTYPSCNSISWTQLTKTEQIQFLCSGINISLFDWKYLIYSEDLTRLVFYFTLRT